MQCLVKNKQISESFLIHSLLVAPSPLRGKYVPGPSVPPLAVQYDTIFKYFAIQKTNKQLCFFFIIYQNKQNLPMQYPQ